MSVSKEMIDRCLNQYWPGYTLRPLQAQIIDAVLQKRDCLALLPTGGGKSLCYQLPAMIMDGICLVISPLVALMQDQVSQLKDRKIAADYIHAGMGRRDIDRVFKNAIHGQLKLLYVAPERLESEYTQFFLADLDISFIAIDEAHCISQWGHDFRPSYLKIKGIQDHIRKSPYLALTATATPLVCEEIISNLELKDPICLRASFERKNISMLVRYEENKYDACLKILKKIHASSIVYARSRFKTQELATYLQEGGISASFYHAGLTHAEREKKQAQWMNGESLVMVCTSAFGMGIDKGNVRAVIHIEPASNLEEYYQEIGRAGRDGENAYAVLLYNLNDLRQLEKNANEQFPSISLIQQIYRDLAVYSELPVGEIMETSIDFQIEKFCRQFKYQAKQVLPAIRILQQEGWLQLFPAMYLPPKLMITAAEHELFWIYESGEKRAAILEFILRNMENVFTFPVPIPAERMEKMLGIKYEEWHNVLQLWQSEGLMEYFPAKDQSQLFFLTRRQQKEYVRIDLNAYEKRKNHSIKQMEAMLGYIDTNDCKQKYILAYFGETFKEDCSRCSICRDNNEKELSSEQRKKMEEDIMALILKNKGVTIRSLVQYFPSNRMQQVENLVEELIDDEKIIRKFDMIYHSSYHAPN